MPLLDCCSSVIGLLKEPVELFRDFDDPPLYLYTVDTANLEAILGYNGRLSGVGAGRTREEALNSCLGEALERYANSVGGDESRVMARWIDLPNESPHPSDYRLFSSEQYASPGFPFRPFSEESYIEWVKATDLAKRTVVWVPSQLVFLAYRYKPDEDRIGYSTSSGSGLGVTPEAAMITGCLESIERDAIMRTWLLKIASKRIKLPTAVHLELPESWDAFLSAEVCEVWDLTALVGIPTAMAAVRSQWPSSPNLVFGSASAPLLKSAVRKAVMEAYHTRCWAKNIMMQRKLREPAEQPMDFEDHVYLYAHPAAAKNCEFLFTGETAVGISSDADIESATPVDRLLTMVNRLNAMSVGAYAVDLTPRDVREAKLFAYHVICPQLCKLSVGMMPPFHAKSRLVHGLQAESASSVQLNPHPHPFP